VHGVLADSHRETGSNGAQGFAVLAALALILGAVVVSGSAAAFALLSIAFLLNVTVVVLRLLDQ
jgi:hypothetical protein